MMRPSLAALALSVAAAVAAISCSKRIEIRQPVEYVRVRTGSGGHGHVFVGANVPFGAIQLGPTSIPQQWDWCSGYHNSDSTVIGFSHTHLSGTGIGDLFDITVMPVIGHVTYARGAEGDPTSGLWSYADRREEIAEPGYYSVPLTRYGIRAEMTATSRVGLHRYTFPRSDSSAVVFDLENGGCWDKATEVSIKQIDNKSISGYRFSTGWAKDQKIYFYAVFSKPFKSFDISEDGHYARMSFKTEDKESMMVKVAISPSSEEGAYNNIRAELPGWDFDKTKKAARTAWNDELSKIRIVSADEEGKRTFYTALYHTAIHPALFSDAGAARDSYTIFSLWDTYRAQMPLQTIINPERTNDFMNTFLDIYRKDGQIPVWHLAGNETFCMVGNPGIVAMSDAIVKGFDGFDRDSALAAMKVSATLPSRGMDLRMKYGYIPCDLFNESVAYDMEYAVADGALANAAKAMGDESGYKYYLERSHSYRHFFDPETRFMRGRDSKGKFIEDFNPFYSNHREDVYCEGNGWQYAWLAPQDFDGLTSLFGSREALLEKLDSLFTVPSEIEGSDVSPDISGLIGQYAHGNEPSHHIIYLYAMADEPGKCADKVREVLSTMYGNSDDGLSGNEDEGQMSAWYVLSSLGFYQIEPASTRFWFGSPLFEKASIKVPGGVFEINANKVSAERRYIQSVFLNGVALDRGYIDYEEIMAGGKLEFKMGSAPAKWWLIR